MLKIKYILPLLTIMILTSCGDDFLDPIPTSAVSAAGYFENEAQLETAVINMYDGIQGVNSTSSNDNHGIQVEFYLTEMRSDNTRTKNQEGEPAEFESYTVTATNGIVADYYRSFYNVIYRSNIVLENLGVATENADKFEAEAKFVRAYAYFNLVRLFGDVPLVDQVIRVSDSEIQYTRVAESTVYDLITSDLRTAINGLDNSSKNRASKAAAQALLAKVLLTQGTDYTEAQSLCESIMSDASYALEENFADIFYNEGNSEVIFAIGFQPDNASDSQNFSAEWLNAVGRTAGVNYVTDEAIAAFEENGGNRGAYSYRVDPIQSEQTQVVKYLPDGDESLGIAATSNDPTSAGNDWIVLRYADVLLMHVEAILAGGNETSAAAAINSFQQVRDRAGLTDAVSSITKDMLIEERRVELAFENHRFFDLVRFGVAQDVLSAYSSDNGYSYNATDLLLPIPQREVNLSNGVLSQNPGY